ncbi:cytochrome P450 [Amycolatopsis sulphurea]|uniref:cytochrome P450 n=1 Tax=Amycolatopsis sulphurea TaxID=76022 RepID=UPI000BF91820
MPQPGGRGASWRTTCRVCPTCARSSRSRCGCTHRFGRTPRDAAVDDVIGGYHIPAGSSILLSPYASHRYGELWNAPDDFTPERFCPAHRANAPKEKYAYYPFGGARRCIGFEAALLEIQLVIATLAQRLRLDLVPGHPIGYLPNASLRPTPNLLMTVSRAV